MAARREATRRAVAACEPALLMGFGALCSQHGARAVALLTRRAVAACEPPLQMALGGGGA